MLPNPEEDIARTLSDFEKRVSRLERLEGGGASTLIEDIKLTTPAASIDFQNIPQIYRNLLLTWSLRSDRVGAGTDDLRMRVNGLATAFYDWIISLVVHPNSFTTSAAAADTSAVIGFVPDAIAPSDRFGPGWVLFPDYKEVAISPGWRSCGGTIRGTPRGDFLLHDSVGTHRPASAISRITLFPATGPNFDTLSQASLYGLR